MFKKTLLSLVTFSSLYTASTANANFIPFDVDRYSYYSINIENAHLPFKATLPPSYACIPLGNIYTDGILIANGDETRSVKKESDLKSPYFITFYYDANTVQHYKGEPQPSYLRSIDTQEVSIKGAKSAVLYSFYDIDDKSSQYFLEVTLPNDNILVVYFPITAMQIKQNQNPLTDPIWTTFINTLEINPNFSEFFSDLTLEEDLELDEVDPQVWDM